MLKSLHIALALLTVTGFVIRAGWAHVAPELLTAKWVRIAPHVVDSLLLLLGVMLALNLPGGFWQGWLVAKMLGLLAYIGFGVLALRGQGRLRLLGLSGALLSAGYIFLVAFSREPLLY